MSIIMTIRHTAEIDEMKHLAADNTYTFLVVLTQSMSLIQVL